MSAKWDTTHQAWSDKSGCTTKRGVLEGTLESSGKKGKSFQWRVRGTDWARGGLGGQAHNGKP